MRHKGIRLKVKMLGPRVVSALQVWLWLLLFIFQNEFRISYMAEPGYLDFDNLPETNFSCAGKVIGGYYADLETDCQMFHVCTIGQLEEPMDIKFLCLNGTVFDQETRVCERVDEVDCSKSEHFYSLNLELYGNTAPPIIKAEIEDPEDDPDEDYDDNYDDSSTTPKTTTTSTTTPSTTTTTTTKRPTTTTTPRPYYTTSKPTYYQTTIQQYHEQHHHDENDSEEDAYDLIEENIHVGEPNKTKEIPPKDQVLGFNDDSQVQRPQSSTGTKKNQFTNFPTQSNNPKPTNTHDNSQIFSPEEFIYHHNNNQDFNRKTPAISFQQQSYSNDGQNSHVTVTTHIGYNSDKTRNENSKINKSYISSSTPKSYAEKTPNYNNFQTFNTPKRVPLIPPNTQSQAPTGHPGISIPKRQKEPLYFSFPKPSLTPQGFKPSNSNAKPTNQVSIKPLQSYQSSERHEVSLESEYDFDKLTPSYPFIHQDFSQYHYDHKRSQDSNKYEADKATTKSDKDKITTPTPYYNIWATRNNNYTKSLPRVIVTASASVSDSNGKKLNYSVGNIVHAVKPLVPTNYDDYKESDVLLDPFFLDVPKLKKGRNKRSGSKKKLSKRSRRQTVIKVFKYDVASKLSDIISPTPLFTATSPSSFENLKTNDQSEKDGHKIDNIQPVMKKSIENIPWTPPDYVDDNYEPLVYQEENSKTNKNVHVKSAIDLTTENNVAKTTLDFVKIETTTVSFPYSSLKNVTTGNELKKYKLSTVRVVNLLNNNSKHSCSDKKFHKLYPDKGDCRTFYMCAPGKSATQILNMIFICDLGTCFNKNITNCTPNKPNTCNRLSVCIWT